MQGQQWSRLKPEVPGPVEEAQQVQHCTSGAAGRLESEVHRPVDRAMKGQNLWRLEPEVHEPVEEALQVKEW